MRHHSFVRASLAVLPVCLWLAACTNGYGDASTRPPNLPPSYSVSGTVTGLNGTGLVLQDDGGDDLSIKADGTFTFAARVSKGSPYNVSVLSQPLAADGTPQTCVVANGAGTMADAPITAVAVTCSAKSAAVDIIGGSVSGLAGTGLVLQNVDGSQIPIKGNGPFTIATGVAPGTPYAVSVVSEPLDPTQNCTIANGAGTAGKTDVTGIVVTCVTPVTPTYTVGGTVTGLAATGATIVLSDNGNDPLTISADGAFTFKLPVASGSAYSVTAVTSGGAQSLTCILDNASGVVGNGNVTGVTVTCQVNANASLTIGGTVTGVTGSGVTVRIQDATAGTLTVSADGPFSLPVPVGTGVAYAITVQPSNTGLTCAVTNGTGTVAAVSITNIAVACKSITFYVPFYASLRGESNAQQGLYVVPSDNPGNAPTLVTPEPTQGVGALYQRTLAGRFYTGQTPYAVLYFGTGADQATHLYSLGLAGTVNAPVATQLSSLALTDTNPLCGYTLGQVNLMDPTTAFVLVDVGVGGACGTGKDVFEVVRFTDAAATAPAVVAVTTAGFDPVYKADGTLGGVVMLDTTTGNLSYYAGSTFTNPVTLIGAVSAASLIYNGAGFAPAEASTAALFELVATTNPASGVTTQAVYRIDPAGNVASVYAATGTLGQGLSDGTNLYFSDNGNMIVQTPLAGGPGTLVIYNGVVGGLGFGGLLSTDGTALTFFDETGFESIALGGVAATATVIMPVTAAYGFAPNAIPVAPYSILLGNLFANYACANDSCTSLLPYPVSSFSANDNGTIIQASKAASMWTCGTGIAGAALQVQDITATDNTFGGGVLRAYDIASNTFAAAPFTNPDGSVYTFPAGSLVPYELQGSLVYMSNTVGAGSIYDSATGSFTGILFDQGRNVLVTINLPGLDATPFLFNVL